ncbi:MAG: PAS domain S-box protein [Deltaproteobacteria bacterium]|nr:PAS domain S-box protein [Deltaproteobacteria bacterium]
MPPVKDKTDLTRVVRDIWERKKEERTLREREERYRMFFNSSNDAVFVHGLTEEGVPGKFIEVNSAACQRLGYTRKELLRLTPLDLVVSQEIDDDDAVKTELLTKKHVLYERVYRAKDGRNIPVEINSSLFDFQGQPAVLSIARDIDERKRAQEKKKKPEAQLRHAPTMKAIGTLASGIAHDFNNLLMAIQGYASLMLMDIDSSHPHYEKLKTIEEQVRRGADLSRQLVGFAGGGKYEARPVNLNEIVEKTSLVFARTRKDITIYQKHQKDIWTVEADQGQIEKALLDLYNNARHSMPGGGDLYVETKNVALDENFIGQFGVEPGDYVRISIADTGVGMDEATSQRIFEPFFSTREMGRGTGLGLASVYGIVTNHGGIITVHGKKGKGTEFNIYLPASKKEAVKERAFEDEALRGRKTILIVDDEVPVLDVGIEILKSLGHTALRAGSGEEAVEVYKANKDKIDLVILDMIMPGIGGGETYDILKAINPDIKVILYSGYSINGEAKKILDRGCNAFLQKPFSIKELSQKIRDVFENKDT